MKLLSWNVNGLRACLNKGFSDFFHAAGADIFCVQETKMQQDQAEFSFPGYAAYWNSAAKKGYSGTAVFTRIKPLSVTYGMNITKHDQEGRLITLEFEQFVLVNIYTPNSQRGLLRLDYRLEWENDFSAYLQKLDTAKPVIVCGDITLPTPKSTLKIRKQTGAMPVLPTKKETS
ncbi:endonuclease/exonuclease/phosphatase [Lucifera butyrica]|uniref:Endonuclease/exonuclease/phosphatase n=1 Tax=Lucifera butyrica TaxID=1351585 RepID=A0A498RFY7_9FIRM|nr:endonuclease/exonuclease/phosphatase [Lucifera butyrica]